MRGVYALVIETMTTFDRKVGSLGKVEFRDGLWVYVGSAMGEGSTSLENRLARHYRKKKRKHWHIDHLLDSNAKIICVVSAQSEKRMECRVSLELQRSHSFISGPRGFGAADCREGCGTHLYYYVGKDNVDEALLTMMTNLGLNPLTSKTLISFSSPQGYGLMNKD